MIDIHPVVQPKLLYTPGKATQWAQWKPLRPNFANNGLFMSLPASLFFFAFWNHWQILTDFAFWIENCGDHPKLSTPFLPLFYQSGKIARVVHLWQHGNDNDDNAEDDHDDDHDYNVSVWHVRTSNDWVAAWEASSPQRCLTITKHCLRTTACCNHNYIYFHQINLCFAGVTSNL